ncbi:MAG: winged helix-turn-helix domain-containing protein [Acidobacteriota bacterium]
MNKEALRYYEFGPFCLNVTERLLHRNADVIPLTPKLVDTLVVLVENRGHVLTKDELMQSLWPDSFVEESSLTQNISLLRKALAENGNGGQYIETIPKRGYRFVAAVSELDPSTAELIVHERTSTQIFIEDEQLVNDLPEPETKPNQLLQIGGYQLPRKYLAVCAGVILLAGASIFAYRWQKSKTIAGNSTVRSIAVLPFQTIGPKTEKELLGLGIANALIIKLSAIDQTKVLPTSSVSKYLERTQEASVIANDLGVDAVLDGTVQRDGDRVRVTAQMIRTVDGITIWSGKYDTTYSNIFALQDAISEEVGSAMIPNLRKDTRDRLAGRLTESREAYEAYVTGFYFWSKRTKANLSKAIDYFEQATREDSKFARAHALLADSYFLASQDGYELMNSSESLAKAGVSVQAALALDDTLAEAHTTKANIAFGNSDYEQAEREFRRALELNPNYAVGHLRYGYFLFGDFRLADALVEMKRAVELDPVSPVSHTARGYILAMSRDFDGAILENQKAIELQPDLLAPQINLAEAYILNRQFPEALEECKRIEKTDPLSANFLRALAYGLSGRRELALKAIAVIEHSRDKGRFMRYDFAALYGAIGDKETAFRYLQQVSNTRFMNAMLKYDPKLDSLRTDQRFEDMFRQRLTDPLAAKSKT